MKRTFLSKIRLLYVEDDENIRYELYELLEEECLELVVADNGQEGFSKYKEFNPDIILTDVLMPYMDGLSMSEMIRKEDAEIPIIISSAVDDSEDLRKAIRINISDYLIKPVDLGKLFETLERVASRVVTKNKLKENEQVLTQYKEIVDVSSIVSKSDKDGIITYVNDAFIQVSGYSKEELIGKNHNLVRDPDMPGEVFKDLWETILSKKRWSGILKNRAKDGSAYIVDSTITPILDLNGDIIEFISLRKDITQIELQKENLKSELNISSKFINEFEKAIKQNTLFCRTTVDGKITMTSEEFDKLLGYESDKLEGLNYSKVLIFKSHKNIEKDIASNIQKAKIWQGLLEHKTKDNKKVYLESSFIPIVGLDGEILEVFGFFVDISESLKLNSEIIETQREVISRMGAISESRSQETGAHVRRVAEYSRLLALKAGLSEDEADELKMASPMHDIGKVGIPDSVLNKPGKHTEEEFEMMKTHTELGYEMLRHSNQKLLRSASIVAYQHHEKWDGSGYPNGLYGENIHIYGRITAIADVFDALGHDRIYKKAWPLENILELFQEEKGRHFDPNLIELFVDNVSEFTDIKEKFSKVS